jgi:hypothetical protein
MKNEDFIKVKLASNLSDFYFKYFLNRLQNIQMSELFFIKNTTTKHLANIKASFDL